jgi:hypothetical protein
MIQMRMICHEAHKFFFFQILPFHDDYMLPASRVL